MTGVFDTAGSAPPPPPEPGATPSGGAPLPATPIGRFALKAIVPALVLPFLAVLASFIRTITTPVGGGWDVDYIVIAVFAFVLIGSNTINTWLLLRHPQTWQQQALPKGQSIALVALWAAELVAVVLVGLTRFNGFTVALALVLIVLSIVVFLFAVIRWRIKSAAAPESAVGLSSYVSVLAWGYLVLVVAGVVVGALSIPATGPVGAVFGVLPFGLPWAWPLVLIAAVFAFSASGLATLSYVFFALAFAGVVVNVVLVFMILFRPAFRVRFVNWFFKLRGGADSIRTFAASSPAET